MGHRRDEYHERVLENLEEREWTQEDKDHFFHMIGHSALMSNQGVLAVLEFQQAVDERIEAEKKYDALFVECPVLERTDLAQQEFNRNIVDL